MIWSVVSKSEMEGFGTSPVFRFYREALGKENIRLAVVEENDPLDFVGKDDIVLLRTASPSLIETIEEKGIISTAESNLTYNQVGDKVYLANFLKKFGIRVPRQFKMEELEEGKTYFVKPRYGSDSMGITTKCICRSIAEVREQVARLEAQIGEVVIEEFIDGIDCTVACVKNSDGYSTGSFSTAAISVECEETEGIQTRDCKVGFKEYCSKVDNILNEYLESRAILICAALGIRHHARIDFRFSKTDEKGELYVIDVNLLPGLGPIDHFSKCFLLAKNQSYTDTIKSIVNSATRYENG